MENSRALEEGPKLVYLQLPCSGLVSHPHIMIKLSQILGLTQLFGFLIQSIHKEANRIILEEWPLTKLWL